MQYISNTQQNEKEILEAIGVQSFEQLIGSVPKSLRGFDWKMPTGVSELELVRSMVEIGRHNRHFHQYACYLGAGNYDHFIPTVVGQLAQRGEFITAYTPYQGEASQGTLQSIYEYQSLICELTGMDYSNASMYDGASSLAEAVLLSIRATERKTVFLPSLLHPHYIQVVRTYLSCLDVKIVLVPHQNGLLDTAFLEKNVDTQTACVVLQNPNFFGYLENGFDIQKMAKKHNAFTIACVNPISLGVLSAPGEYGADIAVGDGQSLGNPVAFGGPHFGFFAVREEWLRRIPGRISGMTVDKNGKRSFVLTLQAREQHIRRQKATSNICTNHALCALKGAIYLSLLGPVGLQKIGLLNISKAGETYEALKSIKGVEAYSAAPFFNEFVLKITRPELALAQSFLNHRIIGPYALRKMDPKLENHYLFCVTENRSNEDQARLIEAIEAI